ncbi:NAD(P)-dependent oxidoreductase [Flavobacterium sp. EDS]|uniref:NAD-dependent epimerase/dehydratase family protein n=1 Tax=Flavobacterium sp. EDS TaxID=2897328 RepID=UPI001E4E9D72|nr:NAD(P)-dependent oxidoreductase [Flavobacterium sp. EDS]MCD0473658.1 NAD(P)-dependent oxidoreductase [Flavobacterium sp. EDS]
MKIFITGVNGFVGKNLFKSLTHKYNVIGFYNSGDSSFENCVKVDLKNEGATINAFQEAAQGDEIMVIHLASQTASAHNLHNNEVLNTNTQIAKSIALAIKSINVKFLVNLSSSSVYPNVDGVFNELAIPDPSKNNDCFYGLSKFNSEVILNFMLSNVSTSILHLRAGIIYGEDMDSTRLIPVLEKELIEKNSITLYGNGIRLLNLIKIENLIKYFHFFIQNPFSDTFNLADECISVLTLAERIILEKGNSNSKIVLKDVGNMNQFVLDTTKIKSVIDINII